MEVFNISLQDYVIRVYAKYTDTKNFCTDYLSTVEPIISITITERDIVYERNKTMRLNEQQGKVFDTYLEALALHRKIVEVMVDHDIILMHGSVVAVDGEAYLFTAKSGTGKSTHTRFWREVFGERAIMVNDDKPLLKLTDDGVLACGTPWDGKHRLSTNVCLPLKAICILERGKENEIHPISPQEALPMVFQQTYRPKNMGKYMEIIDKLMQRVSFYRLKCNMTPEAAKIAYEVMKI